MKALPLNNGYFVNMPAPNQLPQAGGIQAKSPPWLNWIAGFFYGNYFYGLCAVSIMLETAAQLHLNISNPMIYGMAFLATLLFYNHPYIRRTKGPSLNPRTHWFNKHLKGVILTQIVFTIALIACVLYLCFTYQAGFQFFGPLSWFLLFIFPVTAALYYGAYFLSPKLTLRQIGWLKPFLIGFVWAGMANIYPILYANFIYSQTLKFNLFGLLLFFKTFMYVSMIAILFDIKDYAIDQKTQLKTLIVKIGIRRTLVFVIFPFTLLGLLTFISYAHLHQFSLLKMCLIMVPFLLLMASTQLFSQKRSLLFYLVVIDGLLIVKALFGILATYV